MFWWEKLSITNVIVYLVSSLSWSLREAATNEWRVGLIHLIIFYIHCFEGWTNNTVFEKTITIQLLIASEIIVVLKKLGNNNIEKLFKIEIPK